MMTKITDRAVYAIYCDFTVKYLLPASNLTDKQISAKLNKELKKHIKRFYNNVHGVPYTYVEELKQEIFEVVKDENHNSTFVSAKCELMFCIESADDKPMLLGEGFVHLMFDTINKSVKSGIQMASVTSAVNITDLYKGYVQLDNTVFVPIHP
jgi:enoyl-[acyl-carrier-protein] reductase (NADH)